MVNAEEVMQCGAGKPMIAIGVSNNFAHSNVLNGVVFPATEDAAFACPPVRCSSESPSSVPAIHEQLETSYKNRRLNPPFKILESGNHPVDHTAWKGHKSPSGNSSSGLTPNMVMGIIFCEQAWWFSNIYSESGVPK